MSAARLRFPTRQLSLTRRTANGRVPHQATALPNFRRRPCRRQLTTPSSSNADHDDAQSREAALVAAAPLPLPPDRHEPSVPERPAPAKSVALLAATVAAVIITGVGNRLLYKMALTPLANYTFFLAQLQTFGYCGVYFAVLFLRRRAGLVSAQQMALPRRMGSVFAAIGLVEALSSLLSFIAAANLPGVLLPLLSQTVLFWQVLLAYTVLQKRLGVVQLAGVGLVVSGVALAAWPAASAASLFAGVDLTYVGIFIVAMAFPAIGTILKERVFRVARAELKQDLDLFIVNSFGSAAQAVCVFALLPAVTAARGIALGELPQYLASGWQCFLGMTPACGSDCSGAPLLPLLYVVFNLAFNISALSLIRQAGNVVMSLVMSSMIPLSLWSFTLPLPYLAAAPQLGPTFLAGAAVLMAGLTAYNVPLWLPALRKWLAATGRRADFGGGASAAVAR